MPFPPAVPPPGHDLLAGKVVVLTAAAGTGIGGAAARRCLDEGASLALSDARAARLAATHDELAAIHGADRVWSVPCDVTSQEQVQALIDGAVQRFGRIDVMINNAGLGGTASLLEMTEEQWNDIIETNLTGTFRACQVFGRHMIAERYGRIVNIGSLASFVGLHEVAAYTASKSGVAGLTRALAVEWAPHGVCVNAIAPGVFRTELNQKLLDGTDRGRELLARTPMKRWGKVEELAGAAVFLSSDAASFVTGEVLTVDGGFLASGVNQ